MAAKAKGKESRQEEGQEQDTVAREIMTWKFLSLPQISALSEQNIEGVQKKLEEFLNFRQIKTSLKEAVLLDYYVSGFWWAKEMDFTHLQLSGFMAILNFLLENLSTKHITLEDNIKELGRAMAGIGESHSEKGGGLDFFSVDQAKAIISYLKISLFQHYKLYEYLFHNPREELVIGDEQNVVELVKPMDTLFPAPLEEGISYDMYSSFIALPPESEVETEEINQECHPEGLQPETESLDIDPMAGFTIEDVKSVLGQITNEIIGSLQTEINEKLQMEEEAYTVRIDKLKNT
ncbi:ciliary-associated calcium-binding coiled-coil protein 1 isoform X1 [Chrysemys picta bellii]|uniref:ciliary-associated calcium-binding coiled-coil protein 1 isoform X1 n=3 Tax=Chrysemys picta bellii TaxID=8478 RepID=UPI000CE655A5|nr:ciliary-associated calcium-binding coiled-coil protein 1 isoform X1 [Chrysemys picta bellii]